MPRRRTKTLPKFLKDTAYLFRQIRACRHVLFRRGFRRLVPGVVEEANQQLLAAAAELQQRDQALLREYDGALQLHGLTGKQLELKLESFEFAFLQFREEGGEARLRDVLDRASIILNSLAAAIPVVGAFAKELTEFFNKEMRRRLRDSGYDAG